MSIYIPPCVLGLIVYCLSFVCRTSPERGKRSEKALSIAYLDHLRPETFLLGNEFRSDFAALSSMAQKHPKVILRQLMREQVGHFDVKEKVRIAYRMVVRVQGSFRCASFPSAVQFGRRDNLYFEAEQYDGLWVSDPKAVQHISQTSLYNFVKRYAARFGRFALNSATGRGVNDAEGNRIPRLSFDWTQG
jgi:hypothetical protein